MFGAIFRSGAGAMLMRASGEIARHADIHPAAIPVGHDVDPAALAFARHFLRKKEALPRVKPGATMTWDLRP